MTVELEGISITRLVPAFKSKHTQESHLIKLRVFFESCNMNPDDFAAMARSDPLKAEELVTAYVLARREKVSGSTMHNFTMALKLFLAMNDSERLNWVRVRPGEIIPPAKKHGADRAPTAEEPRKILDSCSLRMKCVVLLMLSGGMRVGAFDWPKWRGVEPGDMHRAVDNADWLLHSMGELAKLFKRDETARQVERLRRIESGVSDELVELASLRRGKGEGVGVPFRWIQDHRGPQGSAGGQDRAGGEGRYRDCPQNQGTGNTLLIRSGAFYFTPDGKAAEAAAKSARRMAVASTTLQVINAASAESPGDGTIISLGYGESGLPVAHGWLADEGNGEYSMLSQSEGGRSRGRRR